MQTWKTIDKSDWNDGPWQDEPDKAQWIDETSGLDCLIVRGPSGALCGYVGVPSDHEFFEKDYDVVPVDAHGGLTFSDKCQPDDDPSHGICHTGDVANKVVWWLGFDCAHLGDLTPAYHRHYGNDTYKSFSYVEWEVTALASQLSRPNNDG